MSASTSPQSSALAGQAFGTVDYRVDVINLFAAQAELARTGKRQLDTTVLRAALCCVVRGDRIWSPNPCAETRSGFTPSETTYSITFSARFCDRISFDVMPCRCSAGPIGALWYSRSPGSCSAAPAPTSLRSQQ
jgi:hypothetical protein